MAVDTRQAAGDVAATDVYGGMDGLPSGLNDTGKVSAVIPDPNWFGLAVAGHVTKLAMFFQCRIILRHRGAEADCKRIIDLLALRIRPGACLEIHAEGPGAGTAVTALVRAVGGGH